MYRARLCEQIPPIFSSQVGGPSDLRLSASSSFSAHFQTPFERFSWGRVAMAASPAITAALLVNRYSDDAEAHFYLTPTCRALAASNFYAPYRLPPRATPAPFRPQLLFARRPRVARAKRVHLILKARVGGGLHSGGVRMHDSPGASSAQRQARCVHVPYRVLRSCARRN